MKLTKKHFEAMAKYIRAHAGDDPESVAFIRGMYNMAVYLGREGNPRFDGSPIPAGQAGHQRRPRTMSIVYIREQGANAGRYYEVDGSGDRAGARALLYAVAAGLVCDGCYVEVDDRRLDGTTVEELWGAPLWQLCRDGVARGITEDGSVRQLGAGEAYDRRMAGRVALGRSHGLSEGS